MVTLLAMSLLRQAKALVTRSLASPVGLGLRASFRRQRLLVLCYHGVISSSRAQCRPGYEMSVSAAEFAAQLELLATRFEPLSLAAALDRLTGRAPCGAKPGVLVTFDDGYENNLTLAAPLLRRYGVPAVFFLSTGHIGHTQQLWPLEVDSHLLAAAGGAIAWPDGGERNVPFRDRQPQAWAQLAFALRGILKSCPNAQRLAYLERLRSRQTPGPEHCDAELNAFLNWDQARQLASQGFALGAHTCHHPVLSRLSEQELLAELGDSKARIERELSTPITTLAYPNGGHSDYNAAVIECARSLGYRTAFAVLEKFAPVPAPDMEIPRLIVPGHLPAEYFRFLVSGWREALA